MRKKYFRHLLLATFGVALALGAIYMNTYDRSASVDVTRTVVYSIDPPPMFPIFPQDYEALKK